MYPEKTNILLINLDKHNEKEILSNTNIPEEFKVTWIARSRCFLG